MRLQKTWFLIGCLCVPAQCVYSASPEPLNNPIPRRIPSLVVPLTLETVAEGMTAPVYGTSAPGHPPWYLYVVDQPGVLWQVHTWFGWKRQVLNIRDRIVPLALIEERGFLGVAFHPDFAENGLLYTYTSEPASGDADFSTLPPQTPPDHQTVIAEWKVSDARPWSVRVLPESRREILRIDQPQANHNGGTIAFGPDKKMYISLGDGGGEDDQGPGHGEGGNGQNPGTILGSILRIDPLGTGSPNGQYGVPADNPFVPAAGGPGLGGEPGCADGFCDEIYAYGFRNPYRFSFDSDSGELTCADVGQNDIEEVNIVVPGNYGWNVREGSFCFEPNGSDPGFVYACGGGAPRPDLIDPIAQYDHGDGIAVIGGFVYQGYRFPVLRGFYLFGDFLSGAGLGRLFTLLNDDTVVHIALNGSPGLGAFLLGFGQDGLGEVYILTNATSSPIGRTGKLQRLVLSSEP